MKAISVRIEGRVQGVGYREWARRQAQSLGLDGWIRNEPDGSVAAMVVGEDENVAELVERFRLGPSLASVSSVKVADTTIPAERNGFHIER
ncbi:acylphosphatase [Mesorhizobium sp. J18]|uniref:acylphosphatase n=1 Tax=Mesorhizobium sp. J18 TaxID=935263 RepID=UPI0011994446|nr:acylphosphatase [Mesorhizobium sp. J18]TWH00602.1 acylphosphatase [Mesorhizobium sp. J18]